ncbi:hypothetical protein ACKWTF_005057 [Chironomus riparius]
MNQFKYGGIQENDELGSLKLKKKKIKMMINKFIMIFSTAFILFIHHKKFELHETNLCKDQRPSDRSENTVHRGPRLKVSKQRNTQIKTKFKREMAKNLINLKN